MNKNGFSRCADIYKKLYWASDHMRKDAVRNGEGGHG